MDDKDKDKKSSIWKSLRFPFFILIGLIVYAYGTQITDINLGELRSETRHDSLTRVFARLGSP